MFQRMKPACGGYDVNEGEVRIEFEEEFVSWPGDWNWIMDNKALTLFKPDGSLTMYPIHRILSVDDDRNGLREDYDTDHDRPELANDETIEKYLMAQPLRPTLSAKFRGAPRVTQPAASDEKVQQGTE